MGLNISKGNMYDFVTHTWNAIKGSCEHDCLYCYMKKWKHLNSPRLDKPEMKTNLGQGNFIFVGSSTDMFAQNIPTGWIERTLNHCGQFDNQYLFQTKNPERLIHETFWMPDNSSICVTMETNRWYPEIMMNSPKPENRVLAMKKIKLPLFITIEPVLDFDFHEFKNMLIDCEPKQINIGADSCGHRLPEPSKEKILLLAEHLKPFTKVVLKKNLNRLLK